MPLTDAVLRDRFRGCLLGLAVGDALGREFEGQRATAVRAQVPTVAALIARPQAEMRYTDDTQMAIGVAETLAAHGEIIEDHLCAAFVANYQPSRGYGRGTRAVLAAMKEGRDYGQVAATYFPGGSSRNGASMRVAPVGIFFRDAPRRLWEQARLSALPTHRHPLGVEGAQLLALAVAHCSRSEAFDRAAFFAELLTASESTSYREKLEAAAAIQSPEELSRLGNGIEALESVPTAIASFALAPESFAEAVGQVILLGGYTDTLAAMAGALAGAYLGIGQLPPRFVGLLENSPKGGAYLAALAGQLFDAYQRRRAEET
jgi:poly(ADP-ribose) glycohydrolase ARH3